MHSQLSPAAMRIATAATKHFAEFGYHGSSLNEIATAVGIKKASLYAHFSSKDELFMLVFEDALADEIDFVTSCFEVDTEAGAEYYNKMKPRYTDSVSLRFLLHNAYLPPAHLRQRVIRGYQDYLHCLRTLYTAKLRQQPELKHLTDKEQAHFAHAYLGIIDSLHVELVYANELSCDQNISFDDRRTALWSMLRQSLHIAQSQGHQG